MHGGFESIHEKLFFFKVSFLSFSGLGNGMGRLLWVSWANACMVSSNLCMTNFFSFSVIIHADNYFFFHQDSLPVENVAILSTIHSDFFQTAANLFFDHAVHADSRSKQLKLK